MKFTTDRELPLIEFLKEKIGGSTTKIKKRIAKQDIYVNGDLITEHNPTLPQQSVVEIGNKKPITDFSILFEDQDIIAVEKPVGILSIQSIYDRDKTLFGKVNDYIIKKSHSKERAFIVHRLDQIVSGVILFAKSKRIQETLIENWSKFEKTYHAVVEGHPVPESAKLESWLYEDKNYKVHSGTKKAESKLAITRYSTVKKFRKFALLSVKLGTGKKHQIRVQLSDISCPIIGDTKYGAQSNPIGRIGLHAHTLKIFHPASNDKILFHFPTPDSFLKLVHHSDEA